jgi:hypothetical protein
MPTPEQELALWLSKAMAPPTTLEEGEHPLQEFFKSDLHAGSKEGKHPLSEFVDLEGKN